MSTKQATLTPGKDASIHGLLAGKLYLQKLQNAPSRGNAETA